MPSFAPASTTGRALGRGQANPAGHCLSLQPQMRASGPSAHRGSPARTWAQGRVCTWPACVWGQRRAACGCDPHGGQTLTGQTGMRQRTVDGLHWPLPKDQAQRCYSTCETSPSPRRSCGTGIPERKRCERSHLPRVSQLLNGQARTYPRPPSGLSLFLA